MAPLLLMALGGLAVLAGAVTLRSLGSGPRIGRQLATARRVPVAEAIRMAEAGDRGRVAIEGRIDSDDPFEDAAHQPLVWRRTRIEAKVDGRWRAFEDGVEAVPFEIRDGLDGISVDTAVVGPGVVGLTRESVGVVADLADRAPSDLPPDAPARARIDQISSVEHATVIGRPRLDETGRAVMTAGPDRPLVISTLADDEAMRVLARGERVRPWLATVLLAGGVLLAALGVGWATLHAAGVVDAASTSAAASAAASSVASAAASAAAAAPSPLPSALAGDTRSSGAGPGLVGTPGLAILAVVVLGLLATAATLAYVRLTGGPGRQGRSGS